ARAARCRVDLNLHSSNCQSGIIRKSGGKASAEQGGMLRPPLATLPFAGLASVWEVRPKDERRSESRKPMVSLRRQGSASIARRPMFGQGQREKSGRRGVEGRLGAISGQ